MEPFESVRRLRSMFNLARTAGLLVALSVSLSGCSTDTDSTGMETQSPSPVVETEGYTYRDGGTGTGSRRTPAADVTDAQGKGANHGPWPPVSSSAKVLVGLRTGSGSKSFSFDPDTKVFTVLFVCEGTGQLLISNDEGQQPEPWPCDGVPVRGSYTTDSSPQVIHLEPTNENAQWRMKIVEGRH